MVFNKYEYMTKDTKKIWSTHFMNARWFLNNKILNEKKDTKGWNCINSEEEEDNDLCENLQNTQQIPHPLNF